MKIRLGEVPGEPNAFHDGNAHLKWHVPHCDRVNYVSGLLWPEQANRYLQNYLSNGSSLITVEADIIFVLRMESLNLNTLANSLPNAQQNAEKELLNDFKGTYRLSYLVTFFLL